MKKYDMKDPNSGKLIRGMKHETVIKHAKELRMKPNEYFQNLKKIIENIGIYYWIDFEGNIEPVVKNSSIIGNGWFKNNYEEAYKFVKEELYKDKLINICEMAVVPAEKWSNRDSYSSQKQLQTIYSLLKSNIDYTLHIDNHTIWLEFNIPNQEQLINMKKYNLNIDSIENFKKIKGEDIEIFNNYIEFNEKTNFNGYLPTMEKLNKLNGNDWY